MKSLLVLVLSMSSLFASLPALAGKDAFQMWYQEKFAAQKRAQQTELVKLQQCWLAHGRLMDNESEPYRAGLAKSPRLRPAYLRISRDRDR